MANNTSDDELTIAIDIGKMGGDYSSLELGYKKETYTYTGDELDAIEAYVRQREEQVAREARIDEQKRFIQSSDLAGISNFNGNGLKASKRRIAELEQLTTTHKGDQ